VIGKVDKKNCYSREIMSSDNLSRKNNRWFWTGVFISQFALLILALLFSVRSVWDFINRFLDGITGLKERSFSIVFALLIIFCIVSVVILVYVKADLKKRKGKFPFIAIFFFLIEFLLFGVILFQLFPNLQSMYISQLPHWLFKEGAAYFILAIAMLLTSYSLIKNRRRKDFLLNVLILLNGILLVGLLSFAYIAATVRSAQFGKISLKTELNKSGKPFIINTRNTDRYPIDSRKTIHPDISLKLDMEKGGNYLIAGDVSGDGIVEIITLKVWVEPTDINRVKSMVVQSILVDSVSGTRGSTLWSWESEYPAPANIGGGRGSTAAVVVFDLETGKENRKLLMATDGWLYEFTFVKDGQVVEKKVPTGTVNSSDCLIIANLDGKGKHHLLLKDAYHTIWAYDKHLNLIWKTKNPGGYLLSHRIGAYDVNNDGKDEILAGATILNANGEVLNTLNTNTVKLWYGGHIDGIVPIQQNDNWFISVTYCDGLGFALFDINGNLLWEVTGHHYEYLVGGYFFNTPELKDQFQFLSKVHYTDMNPQVMMNQNGKLLGLLEPSSTVFSADWTGDGYHEMVFTNPATLFSGTERIADFYIPGKEDGNAFAMRVADVIGGKDQKPDGIPDVSIRITDELNQHFLHIYTNNQGKKPSNYVYPGIGWETASNYFTKYFEYDR
jgi:hypothetical protein